MGGLGEAGERWGFRGGGVERVGLSKLDRGEYAGGISKGREGKERVEARIRQEATLPSRSKAIC